MAGIVVLALLVVTEIIAYQYGHRRDALIEKQQAAADQRHDEEMARLHVEAGRLAADAESSKASIAEANKQTEIARKEAAEAERHANEAKLALEKFKAGRILSSQQQADIAAQLKPFEGRQFSEMVAAGVPDAQPLWASLSKTLELAGWIRVKPWGLETGIPPAGVSVMPSEGVTIFIPSSDFLDLNPAATVLAIALNLAGIKTVITADAGPQTRPKVIVIAVGTKPQ